MKTTALTIERPNGQKEIVDVSNKFNVTQKVFDKIKSETAKAGKGNVVQAEIIEKKNNIKELRRNFNNLHNEGGEGFIPEMKNHADYKEWTESTIIK